MNDLEKFHLCFIDVYKASGDRGYYVLVPAGSELPSQLHEQGVPMQGLELFKSRKSLSRSAFSWGRRGEQVFKELEASGFCMFSVESVRQGRLAFIWVHCAGALGPVRKVVVGQEMVYWRGLQGAKHSHTGWYGKHLQRRRSLQEAV